MLEADLIKVGLFLSIVGLITLCVLVVLKIEKSNINKNKNKNFLYWS